jgi:hypothetical protein
MMPDLRYELKLVCEGRWLAQARTWLQLHPAGFVTAFPTRQVNNIYLDTPALDSLNTNLAGTSRRQKLRLRWYGTATRRVRPWLELKSKENLLGSKRRVQMATPIDLTEPWTGILQAVRDTVPQDWHAWLHAALQPTLFNHYQREYYWTYDQGIRATIDFAPCACDQRMSPRANLDSPLPIADSVVIELKAPPERMDRLQEIVGRFPVPRSRNSKYVNGLLTALLTQ